MKNQFNHLSVTQKMCVRVHVHEHVRVGVYVCVCVCVCVCVRTIIVGTFKLATVQNTVS